MFASAIFLLPHGVVSVSIISAIQPEMADRWAAGDRDAFRGRISVGLRWILAVLVPAAVGYIILARPIVAVLLEHGAFGHASADRVAGALGVMVIGLPAYSCWLFLTAAYQSLQDTRTLFFLYVIENIINIVGAVALYPRFGVDGLAFAFALAYIGGTIAAVFDLRRRTGGIDGRAVLRAAGRIGAATAIMGAVVFAVAHIVGSNDGLGAVARVGVAAMAGVTVYIVVARAIGVRELQALLAVRRRP
jgi:putative peptidoglycan lipid II flippase